MAARHIRRETHSPTTSDDLEVPDTIERESDDLAPATVSGLSRFHAITHYVRQRDGRRRAGKTRRVVVIIAVALIALTVGVSVYLTRVNGSLRAGINDELRGSLSPSSVHDPFYSLIVGVDHGENRLGDDGQGTIRADSIILARIDLPKCLVTLLSIPRTTLTTGDDGLMRSIADAYAVGGPSLLTKVVSGLLGVGISHYAEIDFDGFVAAVEQLGGIDITLPVSIQDPAFTGLDLPAGSNHLDGYSALMLARSVHAYDGYGNAERYRSTNQSAILAALARAAVSRSLPFLPGTVAALARQITCDADALTACRVFWGLRKIDLSDDVFIAQVPTTEVFVEDAWYELLDESAWLVMRNRIDTSLSPYLSEADDPTRGISCTPTSHNESAQVAYSMEPEYTGTVSVLNATDSEGLAARMAEILIERGFEASASNAPNPAEMSQVWYNGDDALPKATGVAETLNITDTPHANDGSLPIDANVVVILGQDIAVSVD